jgi:thiamine biosynthesis protein ThiS
MITIDDQQKQWLPGMTLDHVVASLEVSEIYAVVRMNGKIISKPNFSITLVSDRAVIETIPLIAGG